ncbi:MAG: small basic protein [Phycisphaerales bacterium]|nr:small basic protein [Phycisphaerales bacterium]
MSLDRSLKIKGGMAGVRSVYTRAERIAKMQADKKFDAKKNSPLCLPKTRVGKA